jgi:hypothetical protein
MAALPAVRRAPRPAPSGKPRDCSGPLAQHGADGGIRRIIGAAAWARLPSAVQARFSGERGAEYRGHFEYVKASRAGRLLALACRLLGTPVAPFVGRRVPARVRVFPDPHGGMIWERTYFFTDRAPCVVRSTKRADGRGGLLEALPCGVRMPLTVYEQGGTLNFVSRGYFFQCAGLRVPLPDWLPPGQTYVRHVDEGGGWFRFTMSVRHRWLGELFFQTGRFRAADASS